MNHFGAKHWRWDASVFETEKDGMDEEMRVFNGSEFQTSGTEGIVLQHFSGLHAGQSWEFCERKNEEIWTGSTGTDGRWGKVVYNYRMSSKHQQTNSGVVWKSRWTSWAPVPNKTTVCVDVKQHSTNHQQINEELISPWTQQQCQ